MLGQRKSADAEQAFAKAARLTPQWGSLRMRWAVALWLVGKHDEARARLREAAEMELSAGDRRRLSAMWAKATA